MPMTAVAFPILPGKTDEWLAWQAELNDPRYYQEFVESRRRAGVHERTFLQRTPMGDLVIVTLEGDDPEHAFGKMMSAADAFTKSFIGRVKAIHGIDLTAVVSSGSPSELIVDSERATILAK